MHFLGIKIEIEMEHTALALVIKRIYATFYSGLLINTSARQLIHASCVEILFPTSELKWLQFKRRNLLRTQARAPHVAGDTVRTVTEPHERAAETQLSDRPTKRTEWN